MILLKILYEHDVVNVLNVSHIAQKGEKDLIIDASQNKANKLMHPTRVVLYIADSSYTLRARYRIISYSD